MVFTIHCDRRHDTKLLSNVIWAYFLMQESLFESGSLAGEIYKSTSASQRALVTGARAPLERYRTLLLIRVQKRRFISVSISRGKKYFME